MLPRVPHESAAARCRLPTGEDAGAGRPQLHQALAHRCGRTAAFFLAIEKAVKPRRGEVSAAALSLRGRTEPLPVLLRLRWPAAGRAAGEAGVCQANGHGPGDGEGEDLPRTGEPSLASLPALHAEPRAKSPPIRCQEQVCAPWNFSVYFLYHN